MISMKQQIAKWTHTYTLNIDETIYIGKANRRVAFEKRTITIHDNIDNILVNVIETSKISPIIEKIPILNWFTTENFTIEVDEQTIGNIEVPENVIQDKFHIAINNINYSCYYHRGGLKGDTYSIFKEDTQIGKVLRDKKIEWNAHSYFGEFENDTNHTVISIILVLSDVLWRNEDIYLNHTIHEKGFEAYWGLDTLFGKKPDLNWKPKN